MVSFDNLATLIILGLFVIFLIYFLKKKEYKKIKWLFLLIVVYVLYNGFLLFSYIFSMTLDEAMRVASYDRYIFTVIIFIVGVTFIYVLKNKSMILKMIFSCFIIIFIVVNNNGNFANLFGYQKYKGTIRYEIDNYFIKYSNINFNDYRYMVISTRSKLDGYVHNYFNYKLASKNYLLIMDTSLLINYNFEDYDYIIVSDLDDNVLDYLKGMDNFENKVGIYKVENKKSS